MQTRIKIVTTKGGETEYILQKRFDFSSFNLIPIIGWGCFILDLFWEDKIWSLYEEINEGEKNTYYSLEKAKASLDRFWEYQKQNKIDKDNNKIKKTTYLRYP